MQLHYQTLAYDALSRDQLYAILRLRAAVFVVEQNCPYQDLDDKDQASHHVLGLTEEGRLAAYTRLVPKGVSYPEYASIGRVITAPFARGKGVGRPLMTTSIAALFDLWGKQAIKISAQAHLQDFYGSVGFEGVGDIYDEDGIPHRAMVFY
ncbi:GNAT family N-acetyltransferase [Lewinella sp. 4G2]|uniref:GNAT family N-acetyltransferase n=1 Tax=Lewinella sp. 4G2 TaxID=1803372 RepID=UPI0007B4D218|nr:GNAT family N-acetyltransferase [Lewinella sp. 4G2]OAV44502.1 GNAT family acetyltransferase [Lewinella sp. 4G2]